MRPYRCYFNILLANTAEIIVNRIPVHIEYQLFSFDKSEYNGITTPITRPANESLDKSKKYPASFSRLVLSFSLTSFFSSCCLTQYPVLLQHHKNQFLHFLNILVVHNKIHFKLIVTVANHNY